MRDGAVWMVLSPGKIEAGCEWATVRIDLILEPGESDRWADEMERLANIGSGAITLRSHSGQCQATFAMAKKDELHVSVLLQDAPDYLNELRLFLNLPQTELRKKADELRALGRV